MKPFLCPKYKGFYYYYFYKNGKRTNVSTGKKKRSEAEEWVKLNYPNLVEVNNKLTVKEYFDIYLKYSELNLEKNTHAINLLSLKHFSSINSKKYLKDIQSQDLEDFKSELIKRTTKTGKKISKTSANIYLRHLKAAFSYANKKKYLGGAPGEGVKQFKESEKDILCFTDEQIKMILSFSSEDFGKLIRFALLTGMRLSEIKNCQWSDIEKNILTIGAKFRTKSKKIRRLYVTDTLKSLINSIPKNSDYIFNYKDASSISKAFRKILLKAFDKKTADKYHFHCLRHTFITNMLNAGGKIVTVQQIAGHSDIKTTMRYAHISSIDKEAMEMVKV